MLALVVGLIGLIVTSLVIVLILALVLVGVLWVWIHGSWAFRNGPKPSASDVVDVQAHKVAATKTPQTCPRSVACCLVAGRPRIFNELHREKFLPIIERMAQAAGVDAKQALQDALPLQCVMRAVGSKRS